MSDIDDQIQAEIKARLEESGVSQKKPENDQSAIPAQRTRAPAGLPNNLPVNQTTQVETSGENQSSEKTPSQIMAEYLASKQNQGIASENKNYPTDWSSDLTHGAEAVGVSELLRNRFPDYAPYDKKTKAIQKSEILSNERNQKVQNDLANKNLNMDFESHIERGNQLQNQHETLLNQLKSLDEQHQNALLSHEVAKAKTINDFLPEELRYDNNPLTSGEKWNKTGFGVGTGDVNEVSQRFKNMMPKGKIAKNYAQTLYGTQAMRDAKAEAQAQAQALEEERAKYLPQAQAQLAQEQALAQKQAEDIKKVRNSTLDKLIENKNQLLEHRNTPAPTTIQLTPQQIERQASDALQKQQYQTKYGKGLTSSILSQIPGSESRFVVPAVSGAASETWANKAKEAWNKQPDWQHAITDPDVAKYGAATVGSVLAMAPWSRLRGLGVALQAPAATEAVIDKTSPFVSPLVKAYEKYKQDNP